MELFDSAFLRGFIGGGFVTIMGWFIGFVLKRADDDRKRRTDFIDKQISELYGPLSYMADLEVKYRKMRQVAQSHYSSDEKKHELWLAYSNKFIVPLQNEMSVLLQTKYHLLLENHQTIDTFTSHLSDALSVFILKQNGTDIYIPHVEPMPDHFAQDIKNDLLYLKEQAGLLKSKKSLLVYF